MKHGGILGAISEASELSQELGISFEEAAKIQRERSDERLREIEAAQEPATTNVIQFRPRA
jgi:hypothetical protein